MSILGKIISLPIKIMDLPFKVARKVVDDPEPDKGIIADIAKAVEESIDDIFKEK